MKIIISQNTYNFSVTEQAISRYGEDELSIAFNGGKDCTAVLHLLYAVMRRLKCTTSIQSIYIESKEKDEIFPEINDFLAQTHSRYNIQVHQTQGGIKDALGKNFYEEKTLNKSKIYLKNH